MRFRISHIYIVAMLQMLTGANLYADEKNAVEVFLSLTPAPSNQFKSEPHEQEPALIYKVTITKQRPIAGPLPRARHSKLISNQLVIVAADSQGTEITRVRVRDPRQIRSEFPDLVGQLKSQTLYRDHVELSIVLPNNPNIGQIRIYQPKWTGSDFMLQLIGDVILP